MKKLSQKNPLKRNLLIGGIAALILAGGVLAYFTLANPPKDQDASTKSQNNSETPKTNNNPATPQQQDAGSNQKQDIVNRDQNQSTTPPESLTVTITAANQNGSIVNIRSLISTVSASGTCTLTVTNSSATVTKSSSTQALAESSTCQGFDIPTTSLPKGTWHATLSVIVGNAKGSAKKDIVVN